MVLDYTKPHWRRATATLSGLSLDVLDAEVTEELTWCPSTTATLTVAIPPGAPAVLEPLPPKQLTLTMSAGPLGGAADATSGATWRLILTGAKVNWTKGTATLVCRSTDTLALWGPYASGVNIAAGTTLASLVATVKAQLDPSNLYGVTTTGATTTTVPVATVWQAARPAATLLTDIAQRRDLQLVTTRAGAWDWRTQTSLNTPPPITGYPDRTYTPAEVLDITTDMDAVGVYNAIGLKTAAGLSWSSSSYLSATTCGYRVAIVDRSDLPSSTGTVGWQLANRSTRRMTRVRAVTLAHYPLKPGDWIAWQLNVTGSGTYSLRERIERITHRLAGTSDIETIIPG